MYILIISDKGHKQRYCDKVVNLDGTLTIWNYPNWEIIESHEYTSYSTGDEGLLVYPLDSREWDNWHTWEDCNNWRNTDMGQH